MPSTYTSNGGIEKIGQGEQSGAWGTTTNNNFDIIDRLTNGVGAITLSGTTHTLTTSDGSLSDGMYKVLVLGGSPSGTNTITIAPNDADKLYFVKNGTSQSVIFTQGSGANVTITTGKGAIIYADGAGSGAAVIDLTALFLNSQAIDGAVIGGTTPAAITGTTITGTTIAASTALVPDASGGADIGTTSLEWGDVYIADDKKIYFGNDQDVSMEYDEDGTNTLLVSGDITMADDKKLYFGTGKDISLEYDEDGTDTLLISGTDVTIADDKKLYFGTDKDVHIEYDEDGDNVMVLSGGVKFADGATDVDIASHDTSNGLKLGGTLVTATAAELNYSDGVSSNIQTQLNTKVDTAGTALDISGTTMSLETDFLSNSSSAIGSGTASSYTASGSPTFISGKNTSTSTATFTVTVGGSGNTLDMGDGDSGTYDTFATFLPVGGSIAISSGTFSYVAVKMIPG